MANAQEGAVWTAPFFTAINPWNMPGGCDIRVPFPASVPYGGSSTTNRGTRYDMARNFYYGCGPDCSYVAVGISVGLQ